MRIYENVCDKKKLLATFNFQKMPIKHLSVVNSPVMIYLLNQLKNLYSHIQLHW